MPCDIGYKNITRVRVAPKLPQEFKEKTKAPNIDKELLDNLGVEDQVFLDWVSGLDLNPLLTEALSRTLNKAGDTWKVKFSISNGELVITSKYMNDDEKRTIKNIAKKVSERFQIEIIGIIAELLDYRFVITTENSGGDKCLVLEGEKEEKSSVHKYLKVSIGSSGEGVIAFEHFDSQSSLKEERAKFLTLAQKFGIKIRIADEHSSGQPIPTDIEHHHFLKERA